jgi:hypothetical protein
MLCFVGEDVEREDLGKDPLGRGWSGVERDMAE